MTVPVPHRLWLTLGFMAHTADRGLKPDEAERWFPLFDEVRQSLDAMIDVVYAWWLAGPSRAAAQLRRQLGDAAPSIQANDPEGYLNEMVLSLGQGASQRLHRSECIASDLLKTLDVWGASLNQRQRKSELSRLEQAIAPMAQWSSTSGIANGRFNTEVPRSISEVNLKVM